MNRLVWLLNPDVLSVIAARALLGRIYTKPIMRMANNYGSLSNYFLILKLLLFFFPHFHYCNDSIPILLICY